MIGFEREEDEILRYYERVQPHDQWGIWGTELLMRVPLNKAERFMTKDHGWTPETWEKSMLKKDHESILAEMEDYFQFAVEKAITHKGLSAARSVHHYLAWTWLTNDLDLFAYLMEPKNYPNYGSPMLVAVCQKYDLKDYLPDNQFDLEVFLRMSRGQVCSTLCPGGCKQSDAPGKFSGGADIIPFPSKKLILPK